MQKLNSMNSSLFTLLLAMTACDGAPVDAIGDDLGEIGYRCTGTNCGGNPPILNTNVVGGYLAMNWPKEFGEWVDNGSGQMRFTSASIVHLGLNYNVERWMITINGHLRVQIKMSLGGGMQKVWLEGADVFGTTFNVEYDPTNDPSFNSTIKVLGVSCAPGKYMPTETVCRYTLATDTEPTDPSYPNFITFPDLYAVCQDDDNEGSLAAAEKLDVIFAKNTSLDALTPGGVITADDSVDLAACLNSASAKSWWFLNVTYDWLYDPHSRALDPSQLTAILHAWTAWFNGLPRTVQGREVCFDDGVGDLFSITGCSALMTLEGAHNATDGQVCRNANFDHRYLEDAMSVAGYGGLPICPADYTQADGDPTIAVWAIPAG